jgi:drug/metabolite transporter (DMT)-like permease
MSAWLRLVPLIAVFIAVVLNMLSAVLLKTMADNPRMSLLKLVVGITAVIAINGGRFFVWGYAHQKYPLSKTYPLSSIFFPLMVPVSYLYGEVVHVNHIIGAVLITAGVLWLTLRTET